jgi:hypothetical protein
MNHGKYTVNQLLFAASVLFYFAILLWKTGWQQVTVNQLLFAATLFRDSSMINWLAASNFRDRFIFNHTKRHQRIGSR